MSPSQLVIAVFLFTIGFLVGRWALQHGSAQWVDSRAEGRPMPAGAPHGPMPAGVAHS